MNHSLHSTDFGSGAVGGSGYAAQHALPSDAPGDGTQYALPHQGDQLADIGHRLTYFQPSNDNLGTPYGSIIPKVDQPVRRRISRACDQCNQLRTKCDGKQPCAHCSETGLSCEYAREKKKRGKASRKHVDAQHPAKSSEDAATTKDPSTKSKSELDSTGLIDRKAKTPRASKNKRASSHLHPLQTSITPSIRPNKLPEQQLTDDFARCFPRPAQPDPSTNSNSAAFSVPRLTAAGMPEQVMRGVNHYGPFAAHQHESFYPDSASSSQGVSHPSVSPIPNATGLIGAVDSFGDALPPLNSQPAVTAPMHDFSESPLSAGLLGQSPANTPSVWLPVPSLAMTIYPEPSDFDPLLRYPVLKPLLPYISSIIPLGLACDLLEHYFASTSSIVVHPQSPYILGYVFRRQSFLRQDNPRSCNPALLASILWIAAQTSESSALNSAPSARGIICHQLMEVTVDLLKPLVHASANSALNDSASGGAVDVALGGSGLSSQDSGVKSGYPAASGTLDDIATYIHLATVVSASEHKAASLRWWNAAWSLAKELKLGRELPPNSNTLESPVAGQEQLNANRTSTGRIPSARTLPTHIVNEEEKEERRRIWWLLYCMDRHLALCYNRPLVLLDTECSELLLPGKELDWQAGEFYEIDSKERNDLHVKGPPLVCTGHGIFGYFLPLMTILGEIVELNQARNHPRFGLGFNVAMDWSEQAREISRHLDAYGESLKQFDEHCARKRASHLKGLTNVSESNPYAWGEHSSFSSRSPSITDNDKRVRDCILRTKTVVSYGTYLMHTLQILLNGKWDPISLLDDNDLWISSPSFVEATSHAVSASAALNDILDCDPDLSFMPFFMGIYLLQGSFLLLLIADKLQGEASPSVIRACETIVRAHEACIVTLSTEYQKNFRKVMRSALSQVKGRSLEDDNGQQKRRREVLSLYRWTNNGTGLAL